MKTSSGVANVKDCIKYIESSGWKLYYYNRPWYVFVSLGNAKTMNGGKEITFTLTELRHAFCNGW